jgi:hypothetical protein
MKTPCAYIWVPFQLRRSLVAFGLDLPVMSVHGSGAHDALQLQRIPFAAAQKGRKAPSAYTLRRESLRIAGSLEE